MDIISHKFETTQHIQVFQLNIIKEDLKNTALLHLDFSESWKNANQDKIQRAYFGQSSFSIFTACAYTKNGEIRTIPVTVTTESNEHSCVTALTCIHKIISHIEEKVGAFTKFLHLKWWIGITVQIKIYFLISEHFPPWKGNWIVL